MSEVKVTVDLGEGNIATHTVAFTLPLMLTSSDLEQLVKKESHNAFLHAFAKAIKSVKTLSQNQEGI